MIDSCETDNQTRHEEWSNACEQHLKDGVVGLRDVATQQREACGVRDSIKEGILEVANEAIDCVAIDQGESNGPPPGRHGIERVEEKNS
jgi:hypothetical protein